jgi:hypothetical protein
MFNFAKVDVVSSILIARSIFFNLVTADCPLLGFAWL